MLFGAMIAALIGGLVAGLLVAIAGLVYEKRLSPRARRNRAFQRRRATYTAHNRRMLGLSR